MTLIKRSLGSILASFQKTVDELDALQARNLDRAKNNDSKVASLEVESRDLRDEANKAAKVADNIQKLIEA